MKNSVLSLSNYRTHALDQATYTKAQGSSYFSGAAEWSAAQDCGCTGQLPGVKLCIFEKEQGYLTIIHKDTHYTPIKQINM